MVEEWNKYNNRDSINQIVEIRSYNVVKVAKLQYIFVFKL